MLKNEDFEEGEVSDEEGEAEVIEPYKALERPSFAPIHRPPSTKQFDVDESGDSSPSSSDDSSSDEGFRPAKKRQKTNKGRTQVQPAAPSSKKNIWGSVLLEDSIERELKDFDVHQSKSHLNRYRDVETYDYTLALKSRLENEDIDKATENKIRRKLNELDKKDGNKSILKTEIAKEPEDFESTLKQTQQLLNSRKRKMDHRDRDKPKSRKPKIQRVNDLSTTVESTDLELAQDIASKLYEEKIDLILRTVEILGKEATIELFKETQETENDGGILVADGSRRRTPGGVFLHLLKFHDTIPQEKIRLIFSEEQKAKEQFRKELKAKRRQEQREKSKQTLTETDALPALPTRAELELLKCTPKSEKLDNADQISQPGDSAVECDDRMTVAYGDETLVDINFECE